ncbi:MBL fold metallo-hydrolase [Saccharopolyspora sp. NFXS83]|uniref:MBL fold metallo-hydrolase n=1 Tax=Saccharopolyspora sp. NFXS83 TaxID=2993560 RepID=UPI00224B30E0|nr:MBL fold metallo-hydrolase [Saccharopolyspora sp. NFXS83]MCX2729735.1 MBL fold metallo-hydrolase [Saccharopolyspora sp. NFXS83]
MKVHHLNCGTMHSLIAPLICHVLLIEIEGGLTLVDTGFGLQDIAAPAQRLGMIRHLNRPALAPEETAAHQVERLGFSRNDVRHIVLTHFDSDHIGGLSDFPDAQVHLTADEAAGALRPSSGQERSRYRSAQWAHRPNLVEHRPDGEAWRGFAAAKELTGISPGIVLIALPGHTRGHAAVAVDAGEHWVLHAGDAFFHRSTLDGGSAPTALRVQEAAIAHDRAKVRDNHARLAELHQRGEPELAIICAHDPVLLEKMRG